MALVDNNLLDWSFELARGGLLGKPSDWWLERLIMAVIEGHIVPNEPLNLSARQYLAIIDAPGQIRAGRHTMLWRDGPQHVRYWVCRLQVSPNAIEAWLRAEGVSWSAPGTAEGEVSLPSTVDQIADLIDWIFRRHVQTAQAGVRPRGYSNLLKAAKADRALGNFRGLDFLDAYRGVYETEPHTPPVTGWPLREPFRQRLREALREVDVVNREVG